MRTFVTGGTAFIGSHLCRRLLDEGHLVTVLTRHAPPHERGSAPRYVTGDLVDASAVRAAVDGCQPEAVFHLASMRADAADGEASQLLRANGEGTQNLLAACRSLTPAPRVVYTSAMGVYDYENPAYLPIDEEHSLEPIDAYGRSKLLGEKHCLAYSQHPGFTCTILRISGVFGPGKEKGLVYNCLQAAATGGAVKLPRGDVRRDLVYVHDVVEVLTCAAKRVESTVCNIGSGVATPLTEVVEVVERVTGSSLRREVVADDRRSVFYFAIGKAERELGFRPRSLTAAVTDFWQDLSGP